MEMKKFYPKKQNNHNKQVSSIIKPFAFDNRMRYQKGHQNQLLNAPRKTETYTKDKTVIVTESVNVVDFNSYNFEYQFGEKSMKTSEYSIFGTFLTRKCLF